MATNDWSKRIDMNDAGPTTDAQLAALASEIIERAARAVARVEVGDEGAWPEFAFTAGAVIEVVAPIMVAYGARLEREGKIAPGNG